MVQEAYLHNISTRRVYELMKALGLDGVPKSEVSRICGEHTGSKTRKVRRSFAVCCIIQNLAALAPPTHT